MKSKVIRIISITLCMIMCLTGCSSLKNEMISAMNNNEIIQLSVEQNSYNVKRGEMNWVELGQLTNYKELRKTWDDALNIIKFDNNSKNGSVYVDLDGNWSSNNTLYNVFQNKVFVKDYWSDSSIKSKLAQAAMNEFSDITNENTGIVASVNAYFNILPANDDETSGMFNYLTRAEVMSAIYRSDSPVVLNEINENFESAVGKNEYNEYAQNLVSCSYLDYTDGSLNKNSYSSTMTRAEAVYMIVQRVYKDEYDTVLDSQASFTDCKNAGNIAEKNGFTDKYASELYELEYCLQNKDKGLTDKLYKALVVAKNKGIISSDTRWYDGITGGELINMLINAYNNKYDDNNYLVNAKIGANAGNNFFDAESKEPEKVEETLDLPTVQIEVIKDISDINDLASVYGDELDMTDEEMAEALKTTEGFTIEPCDKYMQVDYCYFLNVRVGPGTEFRIKKSVAAGTKVHIVGICAENGWYRVIADGKIAYQCGVYFSDLEGQDTSNLVQRYETDEDLKENSSTEAEETINEKEMTVLKDCGIYEEADETSKVVGTLSEDEVVTVASVETGEDEKEYCQISDKDNKLLGYVLKENLEAAEDTEETTEDSEEVAENTKDVAKSNNSGNSKVDDFFSNSGNAFDGVSFGGQATVGDGSGNFSNINLQ